MQAQVLTRDREPKDWVGDVGVHAEPMRRGSKVLFNASN